MRRRWLLPLAASVACLPTAALRSHADAAAVREAPVTGTEVPALRSLDAAVLSFLRRRAVPGGAVAVARGGRLLYARGYGWADREARQPWEPGALCRIGSVSKPVTAAAVLRLAQDGKLGLDTPAFPALGLQPFLKDGTRLDPRLQRITVRQLLHHTGGWDSRVSGQPTGEPWTIAREMGVPSPATAEQVLRYAIGRPLDFEPGTRFAYSNVGYCALGRAVEKASGRSYESYVRSAVLAPLGVTRMRIGRAPLADRAPGEVRYYDGGARTARSVYGSHETVPFPYGAFSLDAMDAAGGWIASAPDLTRFLGGLVSPSGPPLLDRAGMAALAERPAGIPDVGGDNWYGCGWNVFPRGTVSLSHSGSLEGSCGFLSYRGRDRLVVAALFNSETAAGGSLANEIEGAVHAELDRTPAGAWPSGEPARPQEPEARGTVRADPSVLRLKPGGRAAVDYRFAPPGAGWRLKSRTAYFATADGRRLSGDIGPYATEQALDGSPVWRDGPYLPPEVAAKARELRVRRVVLRQSFSAAGPDGRSAEWRAELAVEIAD